MSRIGKNPIVIPAGVTVTVDKENVVKVTGPKGTLERQVNSRIEVKVEDGKVLLINNHPASDKQTRAYHGLYRQLVSNMVEGVSKGFEKRLNINGVGYKVNQKSPTEITLNVGLSHPVEVKAVEGITLETEKNAVIVKGIDKEKVGQFASYIRGIKPVEPYHAYGISYANEVILRKETKTGKK